MRLATTELPSPLGPLTLVARGEALAGLYFHAHARRPPLPAAAGAPTGVLDEARRQLEAYFAGRRTRFELPLDLAGTPFQRAVWAELARLPFGTTTTYAAIARRLGCPGAARAVGAANALNPVSIVVPCHRVVGADGALTGYAGGLAAKRWLLAHEAAQPPRGRSRRSTPTSA